METESPSKPIEYCHLGDVPAQGQQEFNRAMYPVRAVRVADLRRGSVQRAFQRRRGAGLGARLARGAAAVMPRRPAPGTGALPQPETLAPSLEPERDAAELEIVRNSRWVSWRFFDGPFSGSYRLFRHDHALAVVRDVVSKGICRAAGSGRSRKQAVGQVARRGC